MKLNIFKLKIIAFLSLTLFTLAISDLIGTNTLLNFVFIFLGYMCLPLFCFIISEGYRHTRSINKYLLRVLLLSVLTSIPHRYVCISPENASDPQLFFSSALTGLFCLMSIVIYDKIKNRYAKMYCLIFIVVISFICQLEFAPHALIIMFIIHFCRDKKFIELSYYLSSYTIVIALVSAFILFTSSNQDIKGELYRNIAIVGCIPSLFLIKKYDGTKGPSCKFFSYVYYLLLLVIIVTIKVI